MLSSPFKLRFQSVLSCIDPPFCSRNFFRKLFQLFEFRALSKSPLMDKNQLNSFMQNLFKTHKRSNKANLILRLVSRSTIHSSSNNTTRIVTRNSLEKKGRQNLNYVKKIQSNITKCERQQF